MKKKTDSENPQSLSQNNFNSNNKGKISRFKKDSSFAAHPIHTSPFIYSPSRDHDSIDGGPDSHTTEPKKRRGRPPKSETPQKLQNSGADTVEDIAEKDKAVKENELNVPIGELLDGEESLKLIRDRTKSTGNGKSTGKRGGRTPKTLNRTPKSPWTGRGKMRNQALGDEGTKIVGEDVTPEPGKEGPGEEILGNGKPSNLTKKRGRTPKSPGRGGRKRIQTQGIEDIGKDDSTNEVQLSSLTPGFKGPGEEPLVNGRRTGINKTKSGRTPKLTPKLLSKTEKPIGTGTGVKKRNKSQIANENTTVGKDDTAIDVDLLNLVLGTEGAGEEQLNLAKDKKKTKLLKLLNESAQDDSSLEIEEQPNEADGAAPIMEMVPLDQLGFPFVKSSPIWPSIESMEIFKIMPQNPHFRPLHKFKEEYREGSAIGYMITFSTTVDKMKKLQPDDPQSVFDSCIQTLEDLEKHGFDVMGLRDRLNEFLLVKYRHMHLNEKSSEVQNRIKEHIHEKIRIGEEIDEIDRKRKELVEKRVVRDSEIFSLQSSMDVIAEEIQMARLEFERLASAVAVVGGASHGERPLSISQS